MRGVSTLIRQSVAIEDKLNTYCKYLDESKKENITIDGNSVKIFKDKELISLYSTEFSPTLERFHKARYEFFHRLIMGPRGSGKSVACCNEVILMTLLSDPCTDGIRRSRGLVGRRTYSELETTTIKTFNDWFKYESLGHDGTRKPPRAFLKFSYEGTPVEIEIIFMSFDSPDAAKQAESLELTWAYLNEAQHISQEVLNKLSLSVTRFPRKGLKKKGGRYLHGMIYDSNAFPDYHPLYQKFIIDKPAKHGMFIQPGGMTEQETGVFVVNKNADNLPWLDEDYYSVGALGKPLSFIRTQLCNQFGTYDQGKPCHPDYDKDTHSSDHIPIDPYLPLWLGWDYGGTNACLVAQKGNGWLNIIKEFVDSSLSLTSFALEVEDWLNFNCSEVNVDSSVGDPSNSRSIETANAAHDVINRVIGIKTISAPSNVIKARLEGVDMLLKKRLNGRSGINICRSKCPILHAGMSGKYELELSKVGDIVLPIEKPKKNDYSHPADCLQYICLQFNKKNKSSKKKVLSEDFKRLVGMN